MTLFVIIASAHVRMYSVPLSTEFKTSAQSSLKPSFTVGDVSAVEAQPPVSKSSTPSAQLMVRFYTEVLGLQTCSA